MLKKIIYLNSGHSHLEQGALSLYGVERDLNIAVTDELIPLLEKQGFKVEYIPDKHKLKPSIKWVNNKTSDIDDGLALSVHFNKSGGKGAEAYYYSYNRKSKAIATKLIEAYCKETGLKNRGAKSDSTTRYKQLGWIRKTNVWATLIECAFMDSKTDMDFVIGNFDKVAKGIAKGVCAIYGISYKDKKKEFPLGREEKKKLIIKLVKEL